MLEVGMKGRQETLVTAQNTAKTYCSGALEVFATPAMIGLMEQTAFELVQPFLEEGQGTVGTVVNVTHDAPTPIGMKVWCEATLTAIEGRKLVFQVEAFDECGKIGGGVHERFIIFSEKFQVKANAKKA